MSTTRSHPAGRGAEMSDGTRTTGRVRAAVAESVRPFRATGPLRRLYVAVAIDAVGLGMYLAFSALYLTQGVGLSTVDTGVVLSVSGVASLVGLMPLGALADRLGARRALVLFFVYRAAAFCAVLLAVNFATAVVTVAAAGLISRAIGPVTQAMVLQMAADERERVSALAATRALRNAGYALGALPAAAAAAVGTPAAYRIVLGCTVLAFAVTAWVARRLPDTAVRRKGGERRQGVARDRGFVALTVVNGALSLHAFVLSIGLPLWLVQRTDAPRWLASLLLVVNTVLTVVLQVRMSRGSERPATARRMLVRAGLCLAAVCLLTPLSDGLPGWAAGVLLAGLVVLLTVGELWHTSGSWGLAVARTPAERQGSYLAFFNLGFTVVTIVGPVLMGFLLALGVWGWVALGCWFALLSVASRLLGTRVSSPESPETVQPA
ncbi:MFS transporter [Streptomyces sp. NPDC049577]|uniref:MFS transporter n=1 Tax=Streptomyces sp. NPDC049577 TaxID=3155153 RepID=UPI003412D38A